MAEDNCSPVAKELKETLDNCNSDARVVKDLGSRIRITNIPHSGTHMLPGGVSTLAVLESHWNDWDIRYTDNGETVIYGSKADKDVVITRTA
jgi:hypothetical protein